MSQPVTPARLPRFPAAVCALVSAVLLVLTARRALALSLGGGGFVLCLLLALFLLAAGLLWHSDVSFTGLLILLLPVALAFFLRVRCLEHVTLDYENFLAHWAAFFRDNGGFAALSRPVGNYNVPYLYFLAAISYLKVPDLYCIKLFSILFDVILAWGGMRLVRVLTSPKSGKPRLAFLLLLLLPTVILNGSYWGQCDALYGALVLHALASALGGRPKGSVVLLAIAFSFKLQTVFLLPLWCAFWFTKRVKFSHLWLFPLTYLGTILPALALGKPLGDILGVYLGQTAEYADRLTLNAPSWYAFIPYGVEVPYRPFFLAGLIGAFLLVGALLLTLFLARDHVTDQMLMTAAVILAVGVPLLLPSMHDRYFFLADVITLAWACTAWRRIPQAIGVQFASLGAYQAYLTLHYVFFVRLFGCGWGMLLEALALVLVFVSAWVTLIRQLCQRRPLLPLKIPL